MKKILDWDKYIEKATEAVAEGIVLLKNDEVLDKETGISTPVLPLNPEKEIAVFGRIQLHYYKSGTGSGGMVNVPEVIGIPEGIRRIGGKINEELFEEYSNWEQEHPFDGGTGWGTEPWSQEEMPVSDELAEKTAKKNDTALVILGRTAGEDVDMVAAPGGYYLSEEEERLLEKVRKHFKKMVVLMNVASIIDMGFVLRFSPDAVLYGWQGGMVGGLGTAKVLYGEVSPSGHLSDTIARSIEDYPAGKNFGDPFQSLYQEDIYVGYRYFETFAKEKVLYPFGYGLSYTKFSYSDADVNKEGNWITVTVKVTNTGKAAGKAVYQIYCEQPQGVLGKPSRVLCGFEKTRELAPLESETLVIGFDLYSLGSYDDSGVTGHRYSYLCEAGEYILYGGEDVRSAESIGNFSLEEEEVFKECESALAPVTPFTRMRNEKGNQIFEDVPLMSYDEKERRLNRIPKEIAYTGDQGIKLEDVVNEKNSLEEFIAQLSDEELACISLGEGMGSPKVTPGTAAAFGGVTDSLKEKGVPCGCCTDGPSGMRMDCGTKAFSIPNGTMLACTYNRVLQTELFEYLGTEMAYRHIECLLGPGINIHRYPLNGRNFEYFSEDPFLTGEMAAAQLEGMHQAGVTGTIKHFCGNNQENGRHTIDSVISERALREIYLKGFEIAVKKGNAKTIMTTYGSVNGLWTAGSFDLTTVILREEWGFRGLAMTDWWAAINRRGKEANRRDFAAMVMAQNDLYMTSQSAMESKGQILESLKENDLQRSELQRNAKNILTVLMESNAMKRQMNTADEVEVVNFPEDTTQDAGDVMTYNIDENPEIDLSMVNTERGRSYSFIVETRNPGLYQYHVTARNEQGILAQVPMSLFCMGTLCGTHTWNGTHGEPVTLSGNCGMFSRYSTIRLFFAISGLELETIKFTFEKPRVRVQD